MVRVMYLLAASLVASEAFLATSNREQMQPGRGYSMMLHTYFSAQHCGGIGELILSSYGPRKALEKGKARGVW